MAHNNGSMQATTGLERDRRQDQFPMRYTEQDEFPTACSLPTIYIANPPGPSSYYTTCELDHEPPVEKKSSAKDESRVLITCCGIRKTNFFRLAVFIVGFVVVMSVVLAAYFGSSVARRNRSGSELKRCVQ